MTDDATTLETEDGERLEALWSMPDGAGPRAVAVVTHPHPLMGGELTNPVPAGIARGLAAAGLAVLRFNFRGAGGSSGSHDEGRAEQHDVRAAFAAAEARFPDVPLVGVGYSFGADVLLATTGIDPGHVFAVAVPLRVLPVADLAGPRGAHPTLLLVPEHDQFCDLERIRSVTADWPATTVAEVPGTDHFLAGAIGHVVDRILADLG